MAPKPRPGANAPAAQAPQDTPKKWLDIIKGEEPEYLVPLTEAERAFVTFKQSFDMWLSIPFAQSRGIANAGVPLTILKSGRRWTKDPNDRSIEQCMYLCGVQQPVAWETNAGETVELDAGSTCIISQTVTNADGVKNELREQIHNQIEAILDKHGAIPNMTLVFVPLSKKAAAKGFSRATSWASALAIKAPE